MSTEPPRPRPRPRPRPQPKLSSPGPSSGTGATPSSPVAPSKAIIDEEDALFMRKRRTAKQWKELAEMEKKREPPPAPIDISDDDESPRPHKPKKKSKNVDRIIPDWANKNVNILLTSEEESDSTPNSTENTPTANGKHPEAGKRKRERSRSRSITPPPELSLQQVEQARTLVRRTLESAPRAASPTYAAGDDSLENITLDPELAQILKAMRNSPSNVTNGPDSTSLGGGPEVVTIKVKWQPHPLDDSGKILTYGYKLKRHDTLRDLFAATADQAGILERNIVVSYKNRRLFPTSTPHGLEIWAEAELEACNKTTYEYTRMRKHGRSFSPKTYAADDNTPALRVGIQELSDAEASEGEDNQKLKLTLRSSVIQKDIILTVRPTTSCGALVKAYLKAAGILDQYPSLSGSSVDPKKGKKDPRLSVDGDKMDPNAEVSETGLEDGECAEIVGL